MERQLPKHVTHQNGCFRIDIDRVVKQSDGTKKRFRIRRMLPRGTTYAEADAIAQKLDRGIVVGAAALAVADGWDSYVSGLSEAKGSWLYVCVANMKHRAKERGISCEMTAAQLRTILLRCGGRCEVTGLRFSLEKEDGQRTRPFFHSIDRIDSRGGYTIDNVRVVCHAVNIALNQWGEEVFAEIARGFVFNRYSAFYSGNTAHNFPPAVSRNAGS